MKIVVRAVLCSLFMFMAHAFAAPGGEGKPAAASSKDGSNIWPEWLKFGGDSAEYFVSPDGNAKNDGGKDSPWDLNSTLVGAQPARPGDVIWLRGGTYTGNFACRLKGQPDRPIIIRQYPGENAAIDGAMSLGLVKNSCEHVWLWGFEVTRSKPSRTEERHEPSLAAYGGAGIKLINLAVHDTESNGIGLWQAALDAEAYGCVIYNNGYQGSDRGHGHGFYIQNAVGTKTIAENIVFNQFAMGIHAYGAKLPVKGVTCAGNVAFNNGSLAKGGTGMDDILIGAEGAPLEAIRVRDNYTYASSAGASGMNRMGFLWGAFNKDVVIEGNYWISGQLGLQVWNWDKVTLENNVFFCLNGASLQLHLAKHQSSAKGYIWDNNTYYGGDKMILQDATIPFSQWQKDTHLDAKSKFIPARPAENWIFVRPNKYEPGRANIVIYNWKSLPAVEIDVEQILAKGDRYEVRDAQNYFGRPIAKGEYDGKKIKIPMQGLVIAKPRGKTSTPKHTAPEFGAFILLREQADNNRL